MSILSKRANATARHKIDSKLKTMRMGITENSAAGARVGASHSIFSAKHAIYIRITLNYRRKYSQILLHTLGNHFLSISHKTNSIHDPEHMWTCSEPPAGKQLVSLHIVAAQSHIHWYRVQGSLLFPNTKLFFPLYLRSPSPWMITKHYCRTREKVFCLIAKISSRAGKKTTKTQRLHQECNLDAHRKGKGDDGDEIKRLQPRSQL